MWVALGTKQPWLNAMRSERFAFNATVASFQFSHFSDFWNQTKINNNLFYRVWDLILVLRLVFSGSASGYDTMWNIRRHNPDCQFCQDLLSIPTEDKCHWRPVWSRFQYCWYCWVLTINGAFNTRWEMVLLKTCLIKIWSESQYMWNTQPHFRCF